MDTKETRNYLNSKASTSFTLLKVYYILCIYPKSYIQGILKSKQKNQKTVMVIAAATGDRYKMSNNDNNNWYFSYELAGYQRLEGVLDEGG